MIVKMMPAAALPADHHRPVPGVDIEHLLEVSADRFAELDPANAAAYHARYGAFASKWQAALNKWQAEAAPLRGQPIAVQHRSWVYLENWLGLRRVIALEPKPGDFPNIEAHYHRMMARPAVKKTIEVEEKIGYSLPR